ncbi:unnamed protein product [Closterium sp. NIES-53]
MKSNSCSRIAQRAFRPIHSKVCHCPHCCQSLALIQAVVCLGRVEAADCKHHHPFPFLHLLAEHGPHACAAPVRVESELALWFWQQKYRSGLHRIQQVLECPLLCSSPFPRHIFPQELVQAGGTLAEVWHEFAVAEDTITEVEVETVEVEEDVVPEVEVEDVEVEEVVVDEVRVIPEVEVASPGAGGAGDTGAGGAAVLAGAGGIGGAVATGPGGARTSGVGAAGTGGVGCAGAGDPTEPGAAGAGGAGAVGAGVGGPGAGGAGAARAGVGGTSTGGAGPTGAGAVDPGAGGAGGTVRPRSYFIPLLQQILGVPSSTGLLPPFLCPPPDHLRLVLSCLFALLVALLVGVLLLSPARTLWHSVLPLFHCLFLCPAPPESSLFEVPDPVSDRARAASPTVSRLLATAVTDPSFESAAASALIAELLDFAAACRLDYATALVAESVSARPPFVGGECALGTDVLEDRQEDFECLAAAVLRFSSMLLAHKGDPDALDIPTPRSYAEAITGTYVNEVPLSRANIVDGMWIFRVKRPPGSPPAFKARYVARGFSQRQGVDCFQTFCPTPKMTTLRVLLHVAAQRDYKLHSLDFSPAFLQGSLHEEIWLRRPPSFTRMTTLAALGFAPSTADPSLFLRTDTSLPPFYVLVYVDDLVFATADTEALTLVKSELQKRHTCTDLGELRSYLGLQITRDRARRTITVTQSHMAGPSALRLPVLLATGHSSVY